MNRLLFKLAVFLLFIGCQNEPKTPQKPSPPAFVHPTNPEAVARLWQQFIDKNDFQGAKKLSTDRGQEWISGIETFLAGEYLDSLVTTTEFLNMNCVENDSTAFCVYLFKVEEGEIFQDTFFLIKEKQYWLVDIPEDEGIPTEEELLEFFEENDY